MTHVFEVVDKSGKRIHLSPERWAHIRQDHPEVEDLDALTETLVRPASVAQFPEDNIAYFYRYCKHRPSSDKYLLVIVKYLNGEGFVITAYYVKQTR